MARLKALPSRLGKAPQRIIPQVGANSWRSGKTSTQRGYEAATSLFVKTLSVVESCQSHQQLSTAYKYLNMAYGVGLSYGSVLAIYGVLADKWRQFGCATPPNPVAPPTTEYMYGSPRV